MTTPSWLFCTWIIIGADTLWPRLFTAFGCGDDNELEIKDAQEGKISGQCYDHYFDYFWQS
jgi:hypothetical protein